jgi:predicted nucleotidyltransferase
VTEASSFITRLAHAIEAIAAEFDGLVEVWLFGSALSSDQPADIDLLVVYRQDLLAPTAAASLREPVRHAVRQISDLDAHIVILNQSESAETSFAEHEGARLLYKR